MSSDPPELGKGLFGYRKSVVNQIIADRDIMLRQAEGRVRAAESKVADLEVELVANRDRSTRMEEQLERLRAQFDALMGGAQTPFGGAPTTEPTPLPAAPEVSRNEQVVVDTSPGGEDVFGRLDAEQEPEEEAIESFADQAEEYLYGSSELAYEEPAEMEEASPEHSPEVEEPAPIPSAELAAPPAEPEPVTANPNPVTANPNPVPEPAAEQRAAQVSGVTSRFLNEELASILNAAEESAARIVERAHDSTEHQISESNRLWREVQAELARFVAWREQVDPLIHGIQTRVHDVRGTVEEVPERIRQALAPMADAISSLDGDLGDLASAWNPPLLLTPSGLEHEESEASNEAAVGWEDEPEPPLLYGAGYDRGDEGDDSMGANAV
jgi:hypothetical protein